MMAGDTYVPADEAKVLYPVSAAEQGAINALARVSRRLGTESLNLSRGFVERDAQRDGVLRWDTGIAADWDGVVLQGPLFGVANPLAKQPNVPCKSNKDYESVDLTNIPDDFVPRTNYRPRADAKPCWKGLEQWNGKPFHKLLSSCLAGDGFG